MQKPTRRRAGLLLKVVLMVLLGEQAQRRGVPTRTGAGRHRTRGGQRVQAEGRLARPVRHREQGEHDEQQVLRRRSVRSELVRLMLTDVKLLDQSLVAAD